MPSVKFQRIFSIWFLWSPEFCFNSYKIQTGFYQGKSILSLPLLVQEPNSNFSSGDIFQDFHKNMESFVNKELYIRVLFVFTICFWRNSYLIWSFYYFRSKQAWNRWPKIENYNIILFRLIAVDLSFSNNLIHCRDPASKHCFIYRPNKVANFMHVPLASYSCRRYGLVDKQAKFAGNGN